MSDGSRCTGHCCQSFPLTATMDELWTDSVLEEVGGRTRFGPGEAQKVVRMVLPLPNIGDVQRYTCRHLLPSGDCGNYEDRPRVCRDYPYGQACQNPHCQWGAGRNPPIPPDSLLRTIANRA